MTPQDGRKKGWGGEIVERIDISEIRSAAERIKGKVVRTPLIPYNSIAGDTGIWVKPEILQPIGSFKIRGALNWELWMDKTARVKGFTTISAGNTAQAVGYISKYFAVPGQSIVPANTPQVKIDAIKSYGIKVVPKEGQDLWDYFFDPQWPDEPYNFLNPWAEPQMMAGSGTLGLEIMEDLPEVDTVFVPVGGGGLIGGVGSALSQIQGFSGKVVGVQSDACPALKVSFKQQGATWVTTSETICDGTLVPLVVEEMYPLLREVVDEVVTVSEESVKQAIRDLVNHNKLITEGSGALSLAGALLMTKEERGRSVCILSGGSIQPDKLVSILS